MAHDHGSLDVTTHFFKIGGQGDAIRERAVPADCDPMARVGNAFGKSLTMRGSIGAADSAPGGDTEQLISSK